MIEAHAEGDDAKAAKLRKRLEAAEETAKRLREEKLVGVQRAAQRAEADRLAFVANNYEPLLDERRPRAEQVARDVESTLVALVEAHAAWQATECEVIALMGLAGKGHDRTPEFPPHLAAVVRDVGRFGGAGVPAPVPGGQHRARIHPTDDPDEVVREAARPRFVA